MTTKKKAAKKPSARAPRTKAVVKMWMLRRSDGTLDHQWISPHRLVLYGNYVSKHGFHPAYVDDRIIRVEVREL